MDSFSDSTAKRVYVFTESLGSFRQSFVQVSSVGGGGIFFSICLFLPPSREDINIFKMVVKKLTKALN